MQSLVVAPERLRLQAVLPADAAQCQHRAHVPASAGFEQTAFFSARFSAASTARDANRSRSFSILFSPVSIRIKNSFPRGVSALRDTANRQAVDSPPW